MSLISVVDMSRSPLRRKCSFILRFCFHCCSRSKCFCCHAVVVTRISCSCGLFFHHRPYDTLIYFFLCLRVSMVSEPSLIWLRRSVPLPLTIFLRCAIQVSSTSWSRSCNKKKVMPAIFVFWISYSRVWTFDLSYFNLEKELGNTTFVDGHSLFVSYS